MKKHKMCKYHPDYDPNNPTPKPWQNRKATQANSQSAPATPAPAAQPAPIPLAPGSVLKALLSNQTALQPTQTTVVATAHGPPPGTTLYDANGQSYLISTAKTYHTSQSSMAPSIGSLIDGGCNCQASVFY